MQAPALDILTQNAGETVRRAQARDLAANVVQAVYRVVKLSTLHAIDNQAMVRQVDETVGVIQDFGQRADQNLSILFAHGSIFVGGQLLKANRSIYEGAMELGEVLRRCGASELHIGRDVKSSDFYAFASAVAETLRSPRPTALERPSPRIRLRAVNEDALRREMQVERLGPDAAIVRAYASAVVIMRRFYEDLARGHYVLPQRVKRIAQRLVDLSAGETPAFLGVTSVRNANHDDAGRAVNTAVLSLAMARQITPEPVALVRIAMAALLYDTARPRLTGLAQFAGAPDGPRIVPQLSEQQEEELPAATAVVLTALGRVNEPSVMRTVIAYEAHWAKLGARIGPLYRGLRQPAIQARVIAIARSFNDLLTPSPGQTAMSADEAIATLEQSMVDAADRTVLRLLVGALGIFPTGTLVELSTGEVALVVQTPADPSRYSQPRVRLVFDASGGAYDRPVEIDLARRPEPGMARRYIQRVVATSDDSGAAHLRNLAAAPAVSGVRSQHTGSRGASATPAPVPVGTPHPPGMLRAPPQNRTHDVNAPTATYIAPQAQEASFAEVTDSEHMQATRAVQWSEQAQLLAPITGTQAPAASSAAPARQVTPNKTDTGQSSSRSHTGRTGENPRTPASGASAPTATGDLSRTPFVHLLVYMLDQRLTGTTVFQSPDGVTHGVFFADGVPAKIRTGTIVEPLDRVILDLRLLDEATLRSSLMEISRKKVLHGRYLVTKGLLDRDTIMSVLKLQLVRKLMHLFELPVATRYAYYEGQNLLASYGGPELTPCEPLSVIMAGIRLRAEDPLVDATLERISARNMGLHPASDMRRFDLQKHESAVVDLLRARRMTLAELLQSGVGQDRAVKLTVYALAITRHLDLGLGGRPPVGANGAPVTAAPERQNPAREAADARAVSMAPTPAVPMSERARTLLPHATPTHPAMHDSPTPPSRPAHEAPSGPRAPAAEPSRPARTGLGMAFGQQPGASSGPPGRPSPLPRSTSMSSMPASRGVGRTASPPTVVHTSSPIPSARPSSPSGRSSFGPPSVPPDMGARRAEIEARANSIDSEDYFQMLGITPDALHDQVQISYFGLAKLWHPDRQPPELAYLKPQVARVFARLNEAYQTLTDTQKRSDYMRLHQHGGGTPEDQQKVARVVDAALEFQKAEILLRKHDLVGAELLARSAVKADPEQPEYLTLLVWIQSQRRGEPPALVEGQTTTHYDDLITQLDGVLAKEPRYERALFYRGMLLKRAGRIEKSIRDFRLAADVNPKNLDAVREVRLHDMRKRGGVAPTSERPRNKSSAPSKNAPPPSGGWGRFFKK